jgi:hypothetical protein
MPSRMVHRSEPYGTPAVKPRFNPPLQPRSPTSIEAGESKRLILNGYFSGEQKCCAAVVELDQQHVPAEVIDLAYDQRFFGEASASLTITHRS